MANKEHLAILMQGVEAWNKWRKENSKIKPDLTYAKLSKSNLQHVYLFDTDLKSADLSFSDLSYATLGLADLRKADLSRASFYHADLGLADLREAEFHNFDIAQHYDDGEDHYFCEDASFSQANLRHAKLNHLDFTRVSLTNADLRNTNLCEAILAGDLKGANLDGAKLNGTDFTMAFLNKTILGDVDLSMAIGLESAIHSGPSTLGVDTLYRSSGKIPDRFLRGCGVPDDFIAFIPSHFGIQQAIQFYSCFISYSTKDEEFARRLYSKMRDERLRVWFAPEDIKGGQKIHEQLERAIQVHDRLLIVLSESEHAKRVGNDRDSQGAQSRDKREATETVSYSTGGFRDYKRLGVL